MVIKRNNLLFFWIFLFSFLYFYLFTLARGFGWDGDSFVSACQFIKIINPNIFGVWDGGTLPKLMSIFTFGVFYKIFGNFYALTFLSIILNSLLVALICKWVLECGGYWFIAIIGLLSNAIWLEMVVICDNSAFSLPFVFFGLYYYFHRNNRIIGILFIFIASLFRQGPEIILLLIVFIELRKHNKNLRFLLFLSFLFFIGIIHAGWGYRLAYVNKADFVAQCVLPPYLISSYRNSLTAIFPYLETIFFQLSRFPAVAFFMLSLFGFMKLRKESNDIKFATLSVFASYLFPVSTFAYGSFGIAPSYVLELPVFIVIFSAFLLTKAFFSRIS